MTKTVSVSHAGEGAIPAERRRARGFRSRRWQGQRGPREPPEHALTVRNAAPGDDTRRRARQDHGLHRAPNRADDQDRLPPRPARIRRAISNRRILSQVARATRARTDRGVPQTSTAICRLVARLPPARRRRPPDRPRMKRFAMTGTTRTEPAKSQRLLESVHVGAARTRREGAVCPTWGRGPSR